MTIPIVPIDQIALLVDFDGTLVPIASTPGEVRVSQQVKDLLCQFHEKTHGAVAIVTGRDLDSIDGLLDLPAINLAVSHGAQWRFRGKVSDQATPVARHLGEVKQPLMDFAAEHGLILEDKGFSMALHFRQRPELEKRIDKFLTSLLSPINELEIVPGKCVREIKSISINKGIVIERLMKREPFAGRIPYFFGDDVTDEDGFAWINEAEGISVKVGAGNTIAQYRVKGVDDVLAFLTRVLEEADTQTK